jgi:hypothetical protein
MFMDERVGIELLQLSLKGEALWQRDCNRYAMFQATVLIGSLGKAENRDRRRQGSAFTLRPNIAVGAERIG